MPGGFVVDHKNNIVYEQRIYGKLQECYRHRGTPLQVHLEAITPLKRPSS